MSLKACLTNLQDICKRFLEKFNLKAIFSKVYGINFCLARLIYGAQIMSNNIPAVTICCIAFKHENYIRECLDGFIMQKYLRMDAYPNGYH